MKDSDIKALIERCEDFSAHWEGGIDMKFATAIRVGMRILIREIKRIYLGEERE